MSITVRISLLILIVCGAGFYLFVDKEVDEMTKRYREATEEPLVDFANILAAMVAEESTGGLPATATIREAIKRAYQEPIAARIYEFEKTQVDLRVYVTNEHGMVVFDSDNRRAEGQDYSGWRDVSLTLRGEYGARSSRDDPNREASVLYVAAPIKVDGRIIGALTVGKPTETANLFLVGAKRSTLFLGIVTFSGVAFLIVLLSIVVTMPLHALTRYVRSVRDGERAVLPRIPAGEIRTLGTAFEEMREALEGRKYVERYVQALAHELKSPLTGIKGGVELLREDLPTEQRERFIGNIERETARIQGLIDKLLALSSLQAKNMLAEITPIELGDLVGEVVQALRPGAESKEVTLAWDGASGCRIEGNRFWLREAVHNLVQNAIEFSPRAGTVTIRAVRAPGRITIEVEDEGPGIPEWASEKVFDKFYSLPRPDTGKKSSGLGLTIVREVAELHHGTVGIENRDPHGALARMMVPTPA